MDQSMGEHTSTDGDPGRERVLALYNYLGELSNLRSRKIVDIERHRDQTPSPYLFYLDELPRYQDYVDISWRDAFDGNDEEGQGQADPSNYVLKVKKPNFQRCPEPPRTLHPWLAEGWDARANRIARVYPGRLTHKNGHSEYLSLGHSIPTPTPDSIELFTDDPSRVSSFEKWHEERDIWFETQREIADVQDLFVKLCAMRDDLNREPETYEIMLGTGFLVLRRQPEVNHPILLQRASVRFEADSNTIFIEDTDDDAELYTAPLQEDGELSLASLKEFERKISSDCIHPLDRNNAPLLLKELAHTLTPKGEYDNQPSRLFSDSSIELRIYNRPVMFMRKTLDGTAKAIERVIDDIKDGAEIPRHLLQIAEGGEVPVPSYSPKPIEQRLAEVGGESKEILLAKQANREQLEIARRIERYDAVLVQGPPGTGKTHTIANLTGHFLAQGKNILITSKTSKALAVLKDKLPRGLQNLCVSVLGETNEDMEKSVDGITEYMAHSTSGQMAASARRLSEERNRIINELSNTRKRLFDALNQEYKSITVCGESISPADAARYVIDNKEQLEGIINGPIELKAPFPLSDDELRELYESNFDLEAKEEIELGKDLPGIADIAKPVDFERICSRKASAEEAAREALAKNNWTCDNAGSTLFVTTENGQLSINLDSLQRIDNFESPEKRAPWFATIASTGKSSGAIIDRWKTLFKQIETAANAREGFLSAGFGYEVEYSSALDFTKLENLLDIAEGRLEKYGDLEPHQKKGLFARFHKEQLPDFSVIKVDGRLIGSTDSLKAAQAKIKADKELVRCKSLWSQQAVPCGLPSFDDLDQHDPLGAAQRWTSVIESALSWYGSTLPAILEMFEKQIPGVSRLFVENPLQSNREAVERALNFTELFLPAIANFVSSAQDAYLAQKTLNDLVEELQKGLRFDSAICKDLVSSVKNLDATSYETSYAELKRVIEKAEPLRRRETLIKLISKVAPTWASDIEHRVAPHNSPLPPANIKEAWRLRQYDGIIEEIGSAPVSKLQHDAIDLASRYREKTAQLAEAQAWEHLLRKTESNISLRQDLQGWKDTVKKIGKGTGKRAPRLRKEARRLMASCQKAVPAWIMPMQKALSTLDPHENKFDVVIIDEASQSDVTSLAIAYLAEKLIVVGDDKQVSPVAVGVDTDKEDSLADIYLKNSGIPNAHLYGSKLSLYDIASQTFQALMLKEHFRCVPDIIGYSNMLSYDYKIKPLRDASSSDLLPAVIAYRAENSYRDANRKTNRGEAEEIIRLIKACVAEPEYNGKTFGVISLLGNEQVKLLQQVALRELDPKLKEERQILIGDAANFQGDERDVIFLSMVDSPKTPGAPMNLTSAGADDRTKKRYNVAASRAKDQLWVVYSMDPDSDLKAGDIRKGLIDYARCPKAFQKRVDEVEARAESPFEAEVGKAIIARGYKIRQQWEVGSYRIDMVAFDANGKVAIECDGERWHSSEEAICTDMERQAVLERLGWRFIRIRGSEYYRNPEKTIDRVVKELSDYGVEPVGEALTEDGNEQAGESDLLNRIRRNVREMRCKDTQADARINRDQTIEAALSSSPSKIGPEHGGACEKQSVTQRSDGNRQRLEASTFAVKEKARATATRASEGDDHARDIAKPTDAQTPQQNTATHKVDLQERADAILREIDSRPTRKATSASAAKVEAENHSVHARLVPSAVQEVRYANADISHVALGSTAYLNSEYAHMIIENMTKIVMAEAPIEKQKLFNDTRESLGVHRSGSEIQERNQMILDRRVPHKETEWNGHTYVWRNDQNPDTYALYRPNGPQQNRKADELAYEEMRASILMTMRGKSDFEKGLLIKESARKFGYKRVKSNLTDTFGKAIEQMIEDSLLIDDGDGYVRCNRVQRQK